jgi:hypothetical protein
VAHRISHTVLAIALIDFNMIFPFELMLDPTLLR